MSVTSPSPSSIAAKVPQPVAVIMDKTNKENCQNPKLHSLPFFMDYTGPANVGQYFRPGKIGDDDETTKAIAFRGHLLLGQSIELPDGYAICCAEKGTAKAKDDGEEGVTTFKITNKLPSMDVWEFDERPDSRKKSLQNALVVLRIAEDLAA